MSMADRDGFIWFDGKLVPWRGRTPCVDPHLHGMGVFEGVRAYEHLRKARRFSVCRITPTACSARPISWA